MGTVKDHFRKLHGSLERHVGGAAHVYHGLARLKGDSEEGNLYKLLGDHLDAIAADQRQLGQDLDTGGEQSIVTDLADMTHGQPYVRGAGVDGLTPSNIRVAIPNAPYGSAVTVTAVPRVGQPPMPERLNVPLEFEHLVKVDDE